VPKSRPEMLEATKPRKVPVTALLMAPVPEAVEEMEEADAAGEALAMKLVVAARVTVTRVVAPQSATDEAAEGIDALTAALETALAFSDDATDPTVPSRALVVKLEKP